MVTLLGAAVGNGNAVVMVPSEENPLPALAFIQASNKVDRKLVKVKLVKNVILTIYSISVIVDYCFITAYLRTGLICLHFDLCGCKSYK